VLVEYLARLLVRVHAWNTEFLGRTLGARSIRRSRLSTLACGADQQGGALDPRGDRSHPRGWLASGWCGPLPEADSRPHGRVRRSAHCRAVGNRATRLSWKRAGGETRRSSLLNRIVDYVNTADQAALEARGLLPPETSSGGNGCRLDTCSSAFRGGPPGGGPALLQWPHEGTTIRCAFSMLPEEHPIGLLRWPFA
jgi:hypothetical protein